jgi:hypothetical protein
MTDSRTPIQKSSPGSGAAAAQPPIALRRALVDAIARRRRHRRLRAATAGGVCVAVAVGLLGGGVLTGGPERVLAIEDDGGAWVKVRILDGQAGAEEMTKELQDAGIDGEVRLVPAVPQFVGQWMGIAQVDPPPCDHPENCAGLAGTDASFEDDVFEIRRDAIYKLAETRTILYVGREPEPGETALDFPPRSYDLRVVPLGGNPSDGSESWAESLDPLPPGSD